MSEIFGILFFSQLTFFLYIFLYPSMITSTNCEPGQFLLRANPHDTTVCQKCAEGKSTGGLSGSETCRFIVVVLYSAQFLSFVLLFFFFLLFSSFVLFFSLFLHAFSVVFSWLFN